MLLLTAFHAWSGGDGGHWALLALPWRTQRRWEVSAGGGGGGGGRLGCLFWAAAYHHLPSLLYLLPSMCVLLYEHYCWLVEPVHILRWK